MSSPPSSAERTPDRARRASGASNCAAPETAAAIATGHYAQKQLLSRNPLVRWSHGSRFALARELVAPFAGRRLLDYGCGDGTFLARTEGAPQLGAATASRDTVTYVRLAPDGAVRDTLGRFPGDETQAATSGSGERMFVMVGPPPFGKTSQVAVDASGFWFGSADRYELARYDTTVTLDDDLQHAPEDVPRLAARLQQGDVDLVYGVPESRRHPLHRRCGAGLPCSEPD